MDMSNVNISRKKLGGGAFGNVFKGTMIRNKSQIDIAVKKIPNDGEYYEENARKENEVLRSMGMHENIIEMIGFSCDVHFMYIVMEYADLGDLSQYLEKKIPILNDKIKIMLQCSCAVKYMHNLRPKVIHRDIKPANILLKSSTSGYVVKMADFGLSRIFDPEASNQYMSTDTGTPMYRAPEQFTRGRKQYTSSVDVFSLGLVYMWLLNYRENHRTLEPLPASLQNADLLPYAEYLREAKRNNKPMPVLFTLDCQDTRLIAEIKALVTQMTCFSAEDRISIEQVEAKLISLLPASGETVDSKNTQLHEQIRELQSQLSDVSVVVQENDDTIHRLKGDNRKQRQSIQNKDETIHRLQGDIQKQCDTIQRKDEDNQRKDETIEEQCETILRKDESIRRRDARIRELEAKLEPSTSEVTRKHKQVGKSGAKLATTISFRNVPHVQSLTSKTPTLMKTAKLQNGCLRICCIKNTVYCPAPLKNCIDLYTLDCVFIQSIPLVSISPRSLHPLSSGDMVLAADNGMYIIDGEGKMKTCIQQGYYYDVHVYGDIMVAIQNSVKTDSGYSDCVCVLSATAPYTQTARFTLGHIHAYTVLLHQVTVYVSDYDAHRVTAYSLTGQRLSYWGEQGRSKPGELYRPRLCATDSSGQVLVADWCNHRLQLLSAGREWVVVPQVDMKYPRDVIIVNDRMWVLHGGNYDQLTMYQI